MKASLNDYYPDTQEKGSGGRGGRGRKEKEKSERMGWKQKKNREKLVFTLIKALLNNKIRFVTGVPPSISE